MGTPRKVAFGCCGTIVVCLVFPIALFWFTHSPTRNDGRLKAIAAESQALMAQGVTKDWRGLPKNKWPSAIAGLHPQWVRVDDWGVDIEIASFYDGGWGPDVVPVDKRPPMPMECYESLGYGIYWHDPC